MVDKVALRVPRLESEMLVDLSAKLLKNWAVLIHVHILHDVVDADLGCGYSG